MKGREGILEHRRKTGRALCTPYFSHTKSLNHPCFILLLKPSCGQYFFHI